MVETGTQQILSQPSGLRFVLPDPDPIDLPVLPDGHEDWQSAIDYIADEIVAAYREGSTLTVLQLDHMRAAMVATMQHYVCTQAFESTPETLLKNDMYVREAIKHRLGYAADCNVQDQIKDINPKSQLVLNATQEATP